MASKVNTRFILLFVLLLGLALALLGGVYVLRLRGDATRNFRRGEEAFAKGDYKAASDQFGRALHKEPGNAEYLRRLEASIVKLVPQNAGEASEQYAGYLRVISHAALHNPSDADAHLRLLRELHSGARRINNQSSWEGVVAAADNMQQQCPDGDPKKPYASVYRALGIARLTATQDESIVQQALEDLDQACAVLEGDDLAWSTAVIARLARINRMGVAGKSRTAIAAEWEEVDRVAKEALERVPNGPETTRAHLLYLLSKRGAVPDSVSPEEIRDAAEGVASAVAPDSDSGLVWEATSLIELTPEIGRPRAISVLNRVLQANPQAHDVRMLLARMQFRQDQLDDAEAVARQVLDAEKLPVSFLSQIQYDLKRQAASLIGDVAFRRWQTASDAEKPDRMRDAERARDELVALVRDAESDLMVLRLEAKVAYARRDFQQAAQQFEKLLQQSGGSADPEILSFAAASLEEIRQVGAAHERVSQLVALAPGNVHAIIEKARLELALGRSEQARQTVSAIPEGTALDPRAERVISAVKRVQADGAATTADPVQAAIDDANEAMGLNEPDNARAAMLAALEQNPESMPLLVALAQLELRTGNREVARQYADRGLRLLPNDPTLKAIDVSLRFEDPVDATREYVTAATSEGTERAQAMLIAMGGLSQQQRRVAAAQTSDAAASAKASDIADRAIAQANTAAAALTALDPENPALLEYQFSTALMAKEWTRAEEIVATAKRLDVDRAGGALFTGRLEMARGNKREAVAALEVATDRLSYSSAAWRLFALAHESAGDFAEAERAFEQAYRCNPTDIEGARTYLALLLRRGDKTRALQIIRSVHRLAPQDGTLREAWLSLEAEVGDKALAIDERLQRYRTAPNDRENASALAMLLVGLEPSRETILNDDGQPVYTSQGWASMTGAEQEAARQRSRERWQAMADQIVADLAKDSGDDLRIAVLRATTLRERGDIRGGEALLQEFIDRQEAPKRTEDMYVELGRYQAAVSHFNDAIESLKQAVAIGGPQQREAEVNLAGLLVQLNQHAEALQVLEDALAKQSDQTTQLQAVECLINLNRFDEAETRLKGVASDTSGSVATLLLARIAEGRANELIMKPDLEGAERLVAEQRELLAKAEAQDPTNPFPRILLARSFVEEFNRTQRASLLDDALVALDRAERIRPGRPEASAMRVLVFKSKGDLNGAMAELRRMLEISPENLSARRDLIEMLMDAGNNTGAMAALDAAINDNPTITLWHEVKGDLIMRSNGDARQAVKSYTTAYDHAPSTSMLAKLIDSLMRCDPPDCRTAADLLMTRRDEVKTEPTLCESDAIVLQCLGQHDQAISQLRIAYALRAEQIRTSARPPASIGPWLRALVSVYQPQQAAEAEQLLNELNGGKATPYELAGVARLWVRAGVSGMPRAQELQKQAIALTPEADTRVREGLNYDLAGMLMVTSDMEGAAAAYEEALRLAPTNVNAINNLAFLKADSLGKPAEAIPLVERLLELAADQAPILDTVGWVYYRAGDLSKAQQHLTRSIAILPSYDAYIHLSEVLLKQGDASGAEKQLAEAEKLNPGAEGLQKIKALRDDIGKGAAPGG